MTFIPSPEQQAILDYIAGERGNLAIRALAGTGKTTVLVEGARRLPQQGSKLFCAFNKDIVSELERRLAGTGVRTQTFHSIGLAALKKHLGITQLSPDGKKYRSIVDEWAEGNLELQTAVADIGAKVEPGKRDKFVKDLFRETVKMADELLGLLRVKLVEWNDVAGLFQIVLDYRLDDELLNDEHLVKMVIAAVPEMMKTAEAQVRKLVIDFTDMIYWCVRWDIRMVQYNFVMVDECQDLSPMQRALIHKVLYERDGRIFLVGDPNQAIYNFAGADSDSFDLSVDLFEAHVLPMTLTRRCSQVVVRHAAELVPEFKGLAEKPRGEIVWLDDSQMVKMVEVGDAILCRVKAPLVAAVLEFIAAGKPATILGADIGKALVKILEKLQKRDGYSFAKLLDVLMAYETEQVERYMAKRDEAMAESTKDMCAALRVVIETANATNYDALTWYIESLFSDKGDGKKIILTTVHKSKGLEWERVFILAPDKLPLKLMGMSAEQLLQEDNLDYVARTRAKTSVIYLANDKYRKEGIMPRYAQKGFDGLPMEASVTLAPPDEPPAQLPALLPHRDNHALTGGVAVKSPILAQLARVAAELDEEPVIEPDGTDIYMIENQLGFGQDGDYLDWILKSKQVEIAPIVAPQQKLLALVESLSVGEIDRLMQLLTEVRALKAEVG